MSDVGGKSIAGLFTEPDASSYPVPSLCFSSNDTGTRSRPDKFRQSFVFSCGAVVLPSDGKNYPTVKTTQSVPTSFLSIPVSAKSELKRLRGFHLQFRSVVDGTIHDSPPVVIQLCSSRRSCTMQCRKNADVNSSLLLGCHVTSQFGNVYCNQGASHDCQSRR